MISSKNEKDIKELVDLVGLLSEIVKESNAIVNGQGTSIFLKDEESGKFLLRESTAITGALGNFYIDIRFAEERFEDGKQLGNIGLTVFAILSGKTLRVPDVLLDERSSTYRQDNAESIPPSDLRETHFEVGREELKAFLAVPLRRMGGQGEVFGVVRVVRTRDEPEFSEDDEKDLTNYLADRSVFIENAFSWATLIDIGRMAFNLNQLCNQVMLKLPRIIGGSGCSIFLLDEGKSQRGKRVYSCIATTGLVDKRNQPINQAEAFYEVNDLAEVRQDSTHLTEWVIRNKQNLLVDNLENLGSDTPHLERSSGAGKYNEVHGGRYGGPVLMSPLLSRDMEHVIGVLRVSKAREASPFSNFQKRLFISFTHQLSKAMNTARYMAILDEISTNTEIRESELFKMVVNQVPKLVGAKGCSLFIIRDGLLRLEASSGWLNEKYGGNFSNFKPYQIGEGYTGWVALCKEPLMFNDKGELQNYIPERRPQWSNRPFECEVGEKYGTCDRFLAAPIYTSESQKRKYLPEREVVGVVRIPKMKWEDPFTEVDLNLIKSFAARLSPAIDRTRFYQTTKEKRAKEIEETFSPFLAIECKKLKNIHYKKNIEKFFSHAEESSDDLGLLVLRSIGELWTTNTMLKKTGSLPFDDFKLFEDYLLKRELPNYRDHFIHSYQVFLAGAYIIDQLFERLPEFRSTLTFLDKTTNYNFRNRQENIPRYEAEVAWLMTATFHDIAYPIQLLRDSLDNLVRKLMRTSESIIGNIAIERILFDRQHYYLDCIDKLVEFYRVTGTERAVERWKPNEHFRIDILHLLREERDHGVLGALVLLDSYQRSMNPVVLASSLAIASHKKMFSYIGDVDFKQFPISFLLIFCDLFQEWGREIRRGTSDEPLVETKLERIEITDKQPPSKMIKKAYPTGHRIYVNALIGIQSGTTIENEKKKEIENVFERLKSQNPVFCVSVNEEIVGHS